jgi:hypothetical protein
MALNGHLEVTSGMSAWRGRSGPSMTDDAASAYDPIRTSAEALGRFQPEVAIVNVLLIWKAGGM